MKKLSLFLVALMLMLVSCKPEIEKPTVETKSVVDITVTTAKVVGNIVTDGGSEVTAKGVCWAKTQNPTTENDHVNAGAGVGEFLCEITGLEEDGTYFVRAYATNEAGTAYGEEKSFTTLGIDVEEPETPEEPGTGDGDENEEPENPEEPETPVEPENPEEPETPVDPETPETPETPEEPEVPGENINGYTYVDLGLPSGLKWATHNVGAVELFDAGEYFAWGEVKSKLSFTMENSSTYYVSMDDISGDANYDVATYAWGSTWRMPTESEIIELRDNCTFEWVVVDNNHQGCFVTGPNGNQIYLPSGGFKTNESVDFAESEAAYWTSSPDSSNGDLGYATFFYAYNNNFCNRGWMSRYVGMLVRPVSE